MSRLERRTVFSRMANVQDEECTPDILMIGGFGNTALVFTDGGVVVVDTTPGTSARAIEAIRARTDAPIHSIIYTHGHADHAFAAAPFLKDAADRGHPRPRVIAHELVPKRFDRYAKLNRHNWYINSIQAFARPRADERFMPADVVYPDVTYSNAMHLRLGGLTFELHHYMGETDDGTWVWIPERRTAIAGDVVIGVCPNIGNPFKVQRYELEWAEALEAIAGKEPDCIVPGHGRVLRGELAQEVCLNTARFLRHIHDEVVRLLNEGCWIEEILERVNVPDELAGGRGLAPVYGCPTFVIHGVHRRYAGWYNGNPAELFPSRSGDIAAEVAGLAGADGLLERARELQRGGNVQLALHLADFVAKGTEDAGKRKEALLLKAELLDARADAETNLIARNIFLGGAEVAEDEAAAL